MVSMHFVDFVKLRQFDLARKAYLRLCMLPHHMPLLCILPSQPFLAGAAQPPQTHVIPILFRQLPSTTAFFLFHRLLLSVIRILLM